MIIDQEVKNVDLVVLIEKEKNARINNELENQDKLLIEIIKFFEIKNDFEGVLGQLVALSKKRNQSKKAITEMIKYILDTLYFKLNEESKINLLQKVIEVTEGKIYVEKEYAVSVKRLTEIFLEKGNLNEACKLIQDIQIETFGSVERNYKVDYILYQMKILLKKGDYIRMYIVSNKINRKHLNDSGLENLKIEFYQLMILYYLNEKKFIEVSKCYKILYDFYVSIEDKLNKHSETPIKSDLYESFQNIHKSINKRILFVNYILYLTICPPELETKNMLNELLINYVKDLDESEDMKLIVTKHLSDDIVPVTDAIFNQYRNYPIFVADALNPNAAEHLKLFRKYLIQHNLSIFQKFFSQVHLRRISEMTFVDPNEIESEICDMVINKYIYAKINRINFTVVFKKKQDYSDKLNDLSFDLGKMLEKMEHTCHLIHKENLKYDIK